MLTTNIYAQEGDRVTTVSIQKDKGVNVSGTIKSAVSGKNLSGVNISVLGFSAAITDDNGGFSINVPYLNSTITVTNQGYQTKEYSLKGKAEHIIFLHEEGTNSLYELQTLHEGQVPLIHGVNSTKTINLEKSRWNLTSNETTGGALQGNVAGVFSTRRSGTPNSGASILLRGFNSLYATNQPLIVVDGMIYDNEDYSSELIGNNFSSPLSNIDVKDIDNITVLKDGSSIYGTKGANGVIFITTAHAKELTTKIEAGVYAGFNQQPKSLPLLDASQYKVYLSELLRTKGLNSNQIGNLPFLNDDVNNEDYYTFHNNTKWQDEVLNKSYNQNYYLKVSGGDNIAKYALSMGYAGNGAVVKNTDVSKYNMRLNGDFNLTPKLSLLANLSFFYNQQNLRNQGLYPTTSPIYLGLTKAPFLGTNSFASDGKMSPNLDNVDIFNVSNPAVLVSDNTIGINRNYRFTGNLQFGYKLNNRFNLATIIGLTYDKGRENFFLPNKGITSDTLQTSISTNRSGSEIRKLFSIYNDTYINYKKSYANKHNVNSRLGIRTQTNDVESDFGLGYNAPTDDFVSVGAGSNLLRQVGGSIGNWNWMNIYYAANYNYLNKYFVGLNVALDGSSRFGKNAQKGAIGIGDNKFAFMPSIAGSWLISSEDFMNDYQKIDVLKLRASYGLSGNDDIGNYTSRTYYVSQNLLGMQGLVRGNVGNPYLQWERVSKANLGLDISILKERVNISLDVFNSKTDNMVIYEPVNVVTGLSYMITNNGAMKTNGYELSVNSRVINKEDVKLDIGVNLSRYKNKVTSLPLDQIITEWGGARFITKEGQVANSFYGLKSKGVFSSNAEANAAGLSKRLPNASLAPFEGGDVWYEDLNNDNVIDEKDWTILGNPNPDFVGALNGALTYKKFSLNTLFTFSVGNDIYNGTRNNLEKISGYENQTQVVLNRWRADGQNTSVPKATWGDPMGNSLFSDRWVEDGSYLRLRTISLGYAIPVKSKMFKTANVYLSANNLLTLTNYLGYDPEFSANYSVFGQGVDIGLEPQFKTIQLGFKLGL